MCCVVLRVDELRKLGGVPCQHQRDPGGCGIHPTRPAICRAYQCLWLQGGLEDEDRPDRLGAVPDLVARGGSIWLELREAVPGAFDASPRLRAIAEQHRASMPVRVSDVGDVLNAAQPVRVLLADALEHRIEGEWTSVWRDGAFVERRRLPPLDRWLRRLRLAWRGRRIASYRGA